VRVATRHRHDHVFVGAAAVDAEAAWRRYRVERRRWSRRDAGFQEREEMDAAIQGEVGHLAGINGTGLRRADSALDEADVAFTRRFPRRSRRCELQIDAKAHAELRQYRFEGLS